MARRDGERLVYGRKVLVIIILTSREDLQTMRCVEGKVNLLTQKLSSTPRSNERARRGDRDFTANGVEYFV